MQIDIVITPEGNGESRVYSINSLQVPNVVTQGKTIEEAKKRLREALKLYFEDMNEEKEILIESLEKGNNAPLITRMFL